MARSACRSAGRFSPVRSSSSKPRAPRGFPKATTTAETGAALRAFRRSSRRRPRTACGRRPTTRFSNPTPIARNLTVVPHATAQRLTFEGAGDTLRASGVEYLDADGAAHVVSAGKEVLLSTGAVGSPQLLMVSGVGAADELTAVGVDSVHDLPAVGKHLKDHLHTGLYFEADGIGETMAEIALSLGPDALRAPPVPYRPIPPTMTTCPPNSLR